MTDVLNLATINARLQQMVSAVDANGNGWLRLTDQSSNVLSSFQLQTPSMTVAGGVAMFNGGVLLDTGAIGGGVAALARLEDGIGNVIGSGMTVGPDATYDVTLSNTAIAPGAVVGLTSARVVGH